MSVDLATELKLESDIGLTKREKSAGCGEILRFVSKPGGDALIRTTSLLRDVWNKGLIRKRNKRSPWGHFLIPTVFKMLALIVLCRLTRVRESNVHEQQSGLHPVRGSVYRIFPLGQLLEARYMHFSDNRSVPRLGFRLRLSRSNRAIQ